MGGFMRVLAAIFMAAAFASIPSMTPMIPPAELELRLETAKRRKLKMALASAPAKYRRGRRAQMKPKRRPNRLHISKRVRRKHRRAA